MNVFCEFDYNPTTKLHTEDVVNVFLKEALNANPDILSYH